MQYINKLGRENCDIALKKLKEKEIGLASNQMNYPLNSWINIADYININILLVVHENDEIL